MQSKKACGVMFSFTPLDCNGMDSRIQVTIRGDMNSWPYLLASMLDVVNGSTHV